ncbi:MAG TPA: hypothetical protein VER11_34510 [Polyangiaceae bacterium]|nr:hypothetical protein [Polyangiaceae bacterium]
MPTPETLFDRQCRITLDTIQFDALDAQFTVVKTLKPQPNTCELTVWNLNEEHRQQLQQMNPKVAQATKGIPCKIEAGYKDSVSQIWLGDLRTVETTREGPDFLTKLTSGDGERGWQNGRIHVSYGPQTAIDTAFRAIARALGVSEGNLAKTVSKLKIAGAAIFSHGVVISGAASTHLTELARSAGLEVSIQDSALQFLDLNKAAAGTAVRLSADTGLIESPTVDQKGVLTAKTLMIAGLHCGSLVTVDSRFVKGTYRVEKCSWTGERHGDDWFCEINASRY